MCFCKVRDAILGNDSASNCLTLYSFKRDLVRKTVFFWWEHRGAEKESIGMKGSLVLYQIISKKCPTFPRIARSRSYSSHCTDFLVASNCNSCSCEGYQKMDRYLYIYIYNSIYVFDICLFFYTQKWPTHVML